MSIEDQREREYEDSSLPQPKEEPVKPSPPPVEDISEAEVDDSDIETRMDSDD